MTLQTQPVRTLEQVRAFVEGSESVDFAEGDREGAYALVRRTLVQLGYHRLDNAARCPPAAHTREPLAHELHRTNSGRSQHRAVASAGGDYPDRFKRCSRAVSSLWTL